MSNWPLLRAPVFSYGLNNRIFEGDTMRRFGDEFHEHFEHAVRFERANVDDQTAADHALSILTAAGYDLVPTPAITMVTPVFSWLALLAWRSIDQQQDRFAQAATNQDWGSMRDAARQASCFTALLDRASSMAPSITSSGP